MTTNKGDLVIRAEYYVDGEIQIPIAVKREYEKGNAVTLHSKIRNHNGHVSLITCNDAKHLKHAEFKRVSGFPMESLNDESFQNMDSKHKKFPVLIDYVASGSIPIPATAIKDMKQGNVPSFKFITEEENGKLKVIADGDTKLAQENEFRLITNTALPTINNA